jgi:hypothetical protein
MGFLAPWFLAGMAAVGLPLWIHLLRQYRSTPHPFSSLMFFEQRTQSSIKHRRLRYLALLSLRILLLILMALAFANPFVTRAIPTAALGQRTAILVIDHSFSMRYRDHLARAKQEALDTLARVRGSKAQVIALDSGVHFLSQLTDDPQELRNAIASIQPGDERSSYGELARALRTLPQAAKAPLEIHLFSDMQKSSMPPAFIDLRLPPNTNLVLHSVAEKDSPNWFVESVTAPGKIYDPKKVRVQAVVASINTPAARRTVSLVLDGKVLETKNVDVPENGRASVEFLKLDSPYGFHRGEVRLEPNDALKEDDRFPFAVERADPRRILFLHENGQTRGELFYRTALESAPEAGFVLEPLASDQAANQTLSKYAFVVLSDVASLPIGMEDSLRKYVNGGGAVLIALGPKAAARPRVPVFGESIIESRYASREGDRFENVGTADPEYPSLRKTNKLEGVQFFQVIKVQPGDARVVARLQDQTPLLLEKTVGEGRVLVFASTFDNISNDFPLHPSFVPFIEQTARYLGGQQDRSTNLTVDSFTDLHTTKEQGTAVEVIDPDGKRPLSLREAATIPAYQLTREGFYEIRRANGRQELVAVHADRRESDMSTIPADTLDLWKNTGQGGEAPIGPNGEPAEQTRPWSLWRYALFLVLLFALTESIFASRYLSVEKDAA